MDATRQREASPRRTPAGDVILGFPQDRRGNRAVPGQGREHRSGPGQGRGHRSRPGQGRALRTVAIALGALALAAVITVALAFALRGSSGAADPTAVGSGGQQSGGASLAPGGASPAPGSSVTGTPSIRPYPEPPQPTGAGTPSLRPGHPAPPPGGTAGTAPGGTTGTRPADGPGDTVAARARVAGFVAALNARDLDRANTFLCRALAGHYDASSLDGIEPGSLGVGGVTVQGDSGTAIITYQPTDGSPQTHAIFGLTVEHNTWMLCDPH